jgi:hypothetical protein
VNGHPRALFEAARDLDLLLSAMANGDRNAARPGAVEPKYGPTVPVPKHGSVRDFQHPLAAPEREPRLDAEPVSERTPALDRIREGDDHVDTLLVDAQRRRPGEGGRFDLLPALALGAEAADSDVMNRPPRRRSERLLSAPTLLRAYAWLGLGEAALAMAAFYYAYWHAGFSPGDALPSSGPVYTTATR